MSEIAVGQTWIERAEPHRKVVVDALYNTEAPGGVIIGYDFRDGRRWSRGTDEQDDFLRRFEHVPQASLARILDLACEVEELRDEVQRLTDKLADLEREPETEYL